jgi:hypothetical protein
VDPTSGQSWIQATKVLSQLYYSGVTPAQVAANPSIVPNQPFIQDLFPGAAGLYIPGGKGSATANLFYDAWSVYQGSWTDTLNSMDRIRQPGGGCVSILGCNTFYPTQNSGVHTYTNAGESSYNAMTVSLRRAVTHLWGYDFNYTLSHAIDNASGAEGGGITSGGVTSPFGITNIPNALSPKEGMGPADYDARHQVTADAVVELPVGRGKQFAGNIPNWADEIIGGWQVTTLYTFRTGQPMSCTANGMFNTNYALASWCMLAPGVTSLPAHGLYSDENGIPNIFPNTNVGNDFVPSYAGQVGTRGIIRGLPFWDDDLAVSKYFRLPKENMRLEFRAEAYNLLNHENFANPTGNFTIVQQPGTTTTGAVSTFGYQTFGEITSTNTASAPRVLQMALRLTF